VRGDFKNPLDNMPISVVPKPICEGTITDDSSITTVLGLVFIKTSVSQKPLHLSTLEEADTPFLEYLC
jgi:hypothetical protein